MTDNKNGIKEEDILISFKDISIKCCICYIDYWKSLRKRVKEVSGSVVKFDYSIEKTKSFRKYYEDDKVLFHFCINCFGIVLRSAPLSIIELEMQFRNRGGCIAATLLGFQPFDKICNSCVNFVIERYSETFFKIV